MRRATTLILFFLLFPLLAGTSLGQGDGLARYSGQIVLGLEIDGDRFSGEELEDLVPVRTGDVLIADEVRKGTVNLYRTGRYDKVEVFLKESLGGVRIRYVLYPRKWLERVQFEGNLYVDTSDLLSRIDLRKEEEVTTDRLEDNRSRLEEYYSFRGFRGSEVSYRVEARESERTRVHFRIREGKKLFITELRLEGDSGLSRARVLALIASMPGEDLDGTILQSDLGKIRRHLREKLYLAPSVAYRVEPSAEFPDGVVVTMQIERGPAFLLRVQMKDDRDQKRKAKQMRSVFLKSTSLEKARLTLEKEVLQEYRDAGYPFTSLNWVDDDSQPGVTSITLSIDRGQRALVGGVEIEGARFLSVDRVRNLLGVAEGDLFVKESLEEGIDQLRREYRSEGFVAAAVSTRPLNFVPGEEDQEVNIQVLVTEGPRTLINRLSVNGSPFEPDRTDRLIGVTAGQPYFPEVLERGRDLLLEEMGNAGYLYAAVTVEEPVHNTDGSVDIAITVQPGPMVRLGSVVVAGNESVDARIIRLALNLKKGELLTRNKILKAQEGVYDLRVLSSVDVQLVDPQVSDAQKDLLVQVQERPRYVVGLRVGYGSEDKLRGEASVTNRNVGGMARSLTLRGKASDIEQSKTLLYSHPWFQSLPIDLTLAVTDIVEKRESYSRDALSVTMDLVRPLSESTEVRLGYFFEGLRLFDVSEDAQLSPDDEGRTDVAALVGEILFDNRDDFLDPWSGVLGDLILEYAIRNLGSKTEYYKMELAIHRYLELGGAMVLAGLARAGYVSAYGESEEVIISKRFFLGGQNSVRGYQLDSLGPKDINDDPVGGNYLVNVNLELRYPLYKSLRGVLFLDSGSVWLKKSDVAQEDQFRLRYAAGLGLRWSSPIGPLSVDYGKKLNPATDTEDRYRIHFSIGHAF